MQKSKVVTPIGQTNTLERRNDYAKGAPWFVWSVWALLFLAALVFVGKFGSNVPSWDGWDMVPTLTGEQPITASWLWSQHNEHRVPLPRLVLLGLHRITGINFRTPMFFNVLVLGVLALAMILVAKRLRGWVSYSDAFFPLVLLHWGQAANLLWGWQVQFIASTVLSGLVLLIIVQDGTGSALKTGVMTGLCLVLLPLCGANGLALVPALAFWLVCLSAQHWRAREPHAKRNGALILGLAVSSILLVGLYFIGYESVPYHPTSRGLVSTLGTGVKFLTIGFGPALRPLWPFSGLGLLCLLLLSTAFLGIIWRNKPPARNRALGLLAFLGSMASLALALGLGRYGFETRYVTLAIPVWCCVYFIWTIYGPPRANLALRMLLLIIACLALWPNTRFGVDYARNLRQQLGSFERDMEAGVPSYKLIIQYWRDLHINQEILTDYLPMLQHAGVGKFRFLQENPNFREVSIPLVPTALHQVLWEGQTAFGTGTEPYLVFALPEDRYVNGIRLKYRYSNEEGTAPCRILYWMRADQSYFPENQYSKYCPTGDYANWLWQTWLKLKEADSSTTIWIDDTIKEIRIHPDSKPGVFKIFEIVLLVPAND